MLDKAQPHAPTESTSTDTHPPVFSPDEKISGARGLWQRRSVKALVCVVACGGVAFVFWSWPLLGQLSASTTPLAYALVLAPTGAAMLAALLGFVIWWYLVDYGWTERFQALLKRWREQRPGGEARLQAHLRKGAKRQERDVAASRVRVNGTPRRRRVRHTTAGQLQERRKRQLYQGRPYLGRSRHSDLPELGETLARTLTPTPPEQMVTLTPAPSEQTVTPSDVEVLPAADERDVVLLAAAYLSSEGKSPLSPVVPVKEQPPETPINIYMLKEFIVEVRNKEGAKKTVALQRKRRGDDRYTERDLLAFLAALRGQRVGRQKLLESVFGYGLPNRNRQPEALRNQLNKATQFLRLDINEVASSLGIPTLKVIGSGHDEWYLLTSECRVVDLDEIDRNSATLEGISAQKAMEEPAQAACEAIIKVYKGSFMENYIEDAVAAGSDEWDANWMRQPYTEYLKKYLLAVWYRAEFWRLKAEAIVPADDTGLTLQRTYYETAAKLYEDYVYRAVPGFSDQAAMAFALDAERETIASQAERALRSCLDMYTATGNTQAGEPVYQTFCNRMVDLWSFIVEDPEREWRPRQDTIEAWKNLKAQTKAHRKAGSVTPHDLPREEVRRAR